MTEKWEKRTNKEIRKKAKYREKKAKNGGERKEKNQQKENKFVVIKGI